jgi:hypothetical protein
MQTKMDRGQRRADPDVTDVLSARRAVSMNGRGRPLDNVFLERLWFNVKPEER